MGVFSASLCASCCTHAGASFLPERKEKSLRLLSCSFQWIWYLEISSRPQAQSCWQRLNSLCLLAAGSVLLAFRQQIFQKLAVHSVVRFETFQHIFFRCSAFSYGV